MSVISCPNLGLHDDATVSRTKPSQAHRCYARRPAAAIDVEAQTTLCLSGYYARCPYFSEASRANTPAALLAGQDSPASQSLPLNLPPAKWATNTGQEAAVMPQEGKPAHGKLYTPAPLMPNAELAWREAHVSSDAESAQLAAQGRHDERRMIARRGLRWLWLLVPATAIIAFVTLAMAMGNEWLQPPNADSPAVLPTMAVSVTVPNPAATPIPTDFGFATARPTTAALGAELLLSNRLAAATPVPGGKVVTLGPSAGIAGWWSSEEQRGHLGDSFLYTGRYAGQEFLSAVRFDLKGIPRGASLEQVTLLISGLNADRLAVPDSGHAAPNASTVWLVQLIGEDDAPELETADYLAALSAPAAITLPPLRVEQLAANQVNAFNLDESGRSWLAQQLLDGTTSLLVRLIASGGTGDTLFAWDSGQGPESGGNAPNLVVSFGPPPPTPPPVPTKPFVVATLTPVPANALTVVAQAATATAQATLIGTATDLPFQVYTPTPIPENLETVQAVAALRGLPAVLLLTPTPANGATATEQAAYATAVALTTGTFTPVPTGFVTPIVVLPSPPAQNVATAAALVIAATAIAESPSNDAILKTVTPTPLPFNAVIGVYIYATPVFFPTNLATAIAYNKEINDAILATGTPTPLPWNAIIITTVPTPIPPTPTPIPLFIAAADLTATPTLLPTSTPPGELPSAVRGKILFKSDRGGTEEVYMLDPTTDEVTLVTQSWVFELAQGRLSLSADGLNRALVQSDDNAKLQIFAQSLQYGTVRKVTALGGDNYDPAWSPTGEWIALVSTETGGDEIYRVNPTGEIAQRLTANTWEWDKHPSWSPDGRQIVFYSNRDVGRRQLWIMDADGANQRNLSSNEYNDWDPIWVW